MLDGWSFGAIFDAIGGVVDPGLPALIHGQQTVREVQRDVVAVPSAESDGGAIGKRPQVSTRKFVSTKTCFTQRARRTARSSRMPRARRR